MSEQGGKKGASEKAVPELVPAATVVVLRDSGGYLETLVLRKNSKVAFGGAAVFPGGKIDDEDRYGLDTDLAAARIAAVREAKEEAGISIEPDSLIYFAHWRPPSFYKRRFATWFFAAHYDSDEVVIDDGEIVHYEWMRPADALRRRDLGELELHPPTWVTLHTLSGFENVEQALTALKNRKPRFYQTRGVKISGGTIAMWSGDAGYESFDPDAPGPRHRLVMTGQGCEFDESGYRDD